MISVRAAGSVVAIALALGCAILLIALFDPTHAAGPAAPTASVNKPAKVKGRGKVVVFKLRGPADTGRLRLRGKRKRLGSRALSRARRRGALKVKLPRRWISHVAKPRRKRVARKTRLRVSGGTVGSGLRVGLVTNAGASGISSGVVMDEAMPTGTRWLEEEFDWADIEPQDDQWDWDVNDNLLLEAARRNIRILPMLIDTPSWAGPAWNTIPADPAEFAEYTARVVERYGPGGTLWRAHPEFASYAPDYFQIWNEPYLESFSAGGVDAGRYARLVKAASTSGRAANPAAKYLLSAEQAPSDARHTFIDAMYSAVPDLNSHFDAVAVHPYAGSASPKVTKDGWGFPRIAKARAKFVAHGAQDRPLWLTEIGWSTCPSGADCVSERQQAAYLQHMFELVRTTYSGYVRAAFVYRRTDLDYGSSDALGYYGLQRLDGSHKPAYDVFRREASR